MKNRDDETFVFVSYAHPDRDRVALLIDRLAGRGINVWWDGYITPGSPWHNAIQGHLDRAVCTLVVWTEHSVVSDFVRSEAGWGAPLVPVKLDDAARIPVGFTEYQYSDLTSWDGDESSEFDLLVSTLVNFLERGPRPIDDWMLQDPEWEVRKSLEGTEDLRVKTARLRFIGEISTSDAKANADLRATLREIDKTYKTVSRAIKSFLSPALAQGDIDPTPYLELERDDFRTEVKKGQGHCGLIALHYGRHGGLRDWLAGRAQPEQLAEADSLFASFSDADGDAFFRMVGIADLLKNQSRAVVNLLLARQPELARAHLREAREALAPLEDKLSAAMQELQDIRTTLGYPGD